MATANNNNLAVVAKIANRAVAAMGEAADMEAVVARMAMAEAAVEAVAARVEVLEAAHGEAASEGAVAAMMGKEEFFVLKL